MTDCVLQTERLTVRRFALADAAFLHELVNQPSFKEFIGDKGVHSLRDAERYIQEGPIASYGEHGFGPYVVVNASGGAPVGMNGLFKRSNMDHPDLGFAFLERYFRRGFATESSLGVMKYARERLRLDCLTAIVDPGNARSIGLIEKIGFAYDRPYLMPGEDTVLRCYVYRFGLEP